VRTVLVEPIITGSGIPFIYAVGVYSMAVAYGLYYLLRQRRYEPLWVFGIVFCFFYLAFLLWQTYYAVFTARSSSWGTRPATAGMGGEDEHGTQLTPAEGLA
jgi:hyaluronan synthase